jgi:hypothetical protein
MCYHGYMVHKTIPLIDRFWSRVDKSGDCWVWTAATTNGGYGVIRDTGRNGKIIRAHRLSWELHNGPIPAGIEVCHRCDNPPCVNPAHLFLGTHQDNVTDTVNKGRASGGGPRGSLHHQAKLTEAQVLDIRAVYAAGAASQRQLARKYNVDRGTIQHIVKRMVWTHI